MPIRYPDVLALQEAGRAYAYTERDAILYALGTGWGAEPAGEELPFIYEAGLRTVPTLATVVAWGAGVSTDRVGLNQALVLHVGEETILHRPLPPAATIRADSSVVEVRDRGPERGAVVVRRTVLHDAADGEPIATLNRTILARGDGGFGGPPDRTDATPVPPSRPPDEMFEVATRPDQAALYRLCGDRNPLHIDPRRAAAAGFPGPILHGLCTYGITCRAVIATFCDYDPTRVLAHRVRFSSPVFPGDRLCVELWREGDEVRFEASVPQRNVKVIRDGRTLLQGAA